MADFDFAFAELMAVEGTYSNHPSDSGGETKFGITIGVARKWGYKGRMEDFTEGMAKEIYYSWFWLPMGLQDIKSGLIATNLFIFGVHAGVGTATRVCQRALNILNRDSISWWDVLIDGIMGQKTISTLNQSLNKKDEEYLLWVLLGLELYKYIEIAEQNPKNKVFIRGWMNRLKTQFPK